MYFGLSDAQQSLAAHYAELFSKSAGKVEHIRTDIARIMLPEASGGEGRGLLELSVIAEQVGKAAHGAPLIGDLAAVLTLRDCTPTLKEQWLPRISSGATRFAVAFEGGVGHTQEALLEIRADHISGTIAAVIDADNATHVIVFDRDGGARVVSLDQLATVTLLPTIDPARSLATITFDAAPSVPLLAPANESACMSRIVDALRIALAAEALGAATALLERSVAYAKDRRQFGRAIGSYQGVKFSCAEMATMLEPCKALVWLAAYTFDNEPEKAHELACHTKAHVCDVAREIARTSIELHGAYGFSESSGLHGWFKRIALNRQLLGGPEYCRENSGTL